MGFLKQDSERDSGSAHAFSRAGSNHEADMQLARERSEKRAWIVSSFSILIALGAVGALAVMGPMKTVVPFMVVADKTTGAVEVIDVTAQKIDVPEIVHKYWVSQYVLERESYHYPLLQKQYDSILAWSSGDTGEVFSSQFVGKNAKDKVLGPNIEETVKIISVSLPPGARNSDGANSKMVVRYELNRRRAGYTDAIEPPRTFVANVAYKFEPAQRGSAAELIRNPLGFRVTAYRLDAELVSAQEAVKSTQNSTEPNPGAGFLVPSTMGNAAARAAQ